MASDTSQTPGISNRNRSEPPNKHLNSELDSRPENFSLSALPKVTSDTEEILSSINEKFKKLDKLDTIADDFKELKETVYANGISLEQTGKELDSVKGKVKKVQRSVRDVTRENFKLKEKMLEMSMRDNLIFSGIPKENDENVEDVLKTFFPKRIGYQ